MAYFGMDFLGGSKTKVGKAEMGSQYSGGFARGEQEAFGDVGSARATGEEQRRLAEALRAQAEGRTPSLAAMQYASALEQSQAAAASQLASARGLSPAQAQRLLMTQQSAARAGAAGQSAMMRLQEQQAAQGALANVLAQQRQQSLLGASTASGIGAQAGQLGLAQQQMEQQRLIAEQQIRRQEEAAMEAGVTSALQSGTKAGLAFAGKAKGGEIKGRAQYSGDTRSNDTVPALLSPGEIVLPRSVAQDEDAPEKSKKFVEAIKKQKKPAGKASIAAALARIQELEARLNAMEALADLEAEEQG